MARYEDISKRQKLNLNHSRRFFLCAVFLLSTFTITMYFCLSIESRKSYVLSFQAYIDDITFYLNDNGKTKIDYLLGLSAENSLNPKFVHKEEAQILYPDVTMEPHLISRSEFNIFFIETTCGTYTSKRTNSPETYDSIIMNTRDACAIESSARINMNHTVYILYTCPLDEYIFDNSPAHIKELFQFGNVKIVKLIMSEYFKGSPVEGLFKSGKLGRSLYPLEHTSDVMRFLTLWKYGGTYMDLDVLSIRPIEKLGSNYAGYETRDAIGSAVLNFHHSGFGHSLLNGILIYLNANFTGKLWGDNGPGLVTKTLMDLCGHAMVKGDTEVCKGFTIFRPEVFFPLKWDEWNLFFDSNNSDNILRRMRNSYCVHVWNKNSHKQKVIVSSRQPYEILASKLCPLVHSKLETWSYK